MLYTGRRIKADKVALKPHQGFGNLFPKPKDPVPKDQARDVIYSIPCKVCDKPATSGRPNGNLILDSENTKSGRTKTSQEICTRRTLFTIWSHYLVEIVYNITSVPAQVGEPDAFWKHGKSTRAKVHSIAMTACTCPKSTGP